MTGNSISDAAKAVVRRNTEEVQGGGNFDVFEELFADDFVDHTTQPGTTPDKAGVRKLYIYMREAFPDFHAEIHWQLADGDQVTTYKTYRHARWPIPRNCSDASQNSFRIGRRDARAERQNHGPLGSRQFAVSHATDRRMDTLRVRGDFAGGIV